MKKILSIILLLSAMCSVKAQTQQVVTYPGYVSYWNPSTKIPDSVIWVTKPHTKVAGRASGFHSTGERLNLTKDYAGSGYDIGHNCNASDENGNATDEYNSFDFVNTYPQRPNCNRLVWLQLENRVRDLAIQYKAVKNKVYWTGISGYIGKDNVAIPKICIKEIWYNGVHEYYAVPNNDTVNRHNYIYYQIKLK